jgi:murein DD-endopeptidase MepM/ murein hydrolase activator NlpD
VKKVYYHYALDFGGAEGMADVVAATDGLVVSIAGQTLKGHEKDTPVAARYDVIYVLDDRGWYYRYSHLKSFETNIRLGERVRMGQKVGELGKEGGSGGWSHFHFGIDARQPSGKWGSEDAYAFAWEAYVNRYQPALIAVARPHLLAAVGKKVALDGRKSVSFAGVPRKYEWTFSDGSQGSGPLQTRVYTRPGTYSEVLKVTDSAGNVDCDFTTVNVADLKTPDRLPPTIHAAFSPTMGIRAGDPVTFKVRTFRAGPGKETWDFGDGSAPALSSSNPEGVHAEDGYAVVIHRFAKSGRYIVRVTRSNEVGPATTHVEVVVE